MTRIDHAARAQRSMGVADSLVNGQATTPFEIANHELTKGQISATLALVEQQRIANLIALSHPQAIGTNGVTVQIALYDDDGALRFDIAAALGIEVAS